MSDYIERKKRSENQFLSQLYAEAERRAELFMHGHPETQVEQFVAKDLGVSSVIITVIGVLFIVMVAIN